MSSPANVLVVLLDDVGVDQISAYGWPGSPPTPTIDALAQRGTRFQRAWATPVCSPTRAALLTGQFAHRTNVGAVIHAGMSAELPLARVTIPEGLDGAPIHWSSAAIGKWHLSTASSPSGSEHPWLQGFDQFSGSLNNISAPRTYADWERVGFDRQIVQETRFSTDAIVDDALDAASRLSEPFFLYVALHAAHIPLMAPPGVELADPTDHRALYAANVGYADTQLARLFTGLGDRLDHTLVFVIGDNGTPGDATEGEGMMGAKGSFLEGGLNVPFVVAGPGVAVGATSDALVSVVDVFPTVMELAGVGSTADPIDGMSLLPALRDPATPVHALHYSELRHPPVGAPWRRVERAVSDGTFKLLDVLGEGEVWYTTGGDGVEAEVSDRAVPKVVQKALRKELANHPVGVTRRGAPEAPSRSDR